MIPMTISQCYKLLPLKKRRRWFEVSLILPMTIHQCCNLMLSKNRMGWFEVLMMLPMTIRFNVRRIIRLSGT
jgi:hypothetical protein